MKLKIRYDDKIQELELNQKDTEDLWVSLSLEGEGLSETDKEQLIQDTWDERFNKEEYNNWHKHNRHSGNAKMKGKDGTVEVNTDEAIMEHAIDKSAFTRDIDSLENKLSYEEWCEKIRSHFASDIADMLIAIALDGLTVEQYAAVIGDKPNNVSHRYRRAVKKFKEIFPRASF